MPQGDPPVYQLVDSNGNVQAEIRHDLAQSLIIDQLNGSDIDFQDSDLSNIASVSAVRGQITRQSPILIGSAGLRMDFDGSGPDARLDNALSAASDGDKIILEAATYTAARTITKQVRLVGTNHRQGTRFEGDLSLDGNAVTLKSGVTVNLTVTVNGNNCRFLDFDTFGTSVSVAGDKCMISQVQSGSVTFQSGTSGGIVDSCIGASVTDNGSNTVGDIG